MSTKKNVLVFGWFGKGNLGDESFRQAYVELWGSKANLTFSDCVPKDINDRFDCCLIGGGSFLDQAIPDIDRIKIPCGFIGVGIHDAVHEKNKATLSSAKMVIARNSDFDYPIEAFIANDLTFARSAFPRTPPPEKKKTVLVLGNDFLVPRKSDPYWKHSGFHWFVSEFSALLDEYIAEDWNVEFFPMCTPSEFSRGALHDDRVFSMHAIAQMEHRDKVTNHLDIATEEMFAAKLRAATLIISLRFHGNIFATIFGKRFIGIVSHDKMRSFFTGLRFNNFLDYYGFNKKEFRACESSRLVGAEQLKDTWHRERERWLYLSDIVADRFGM